ncbi:MAG TPA: SOS response-associated peptidase [Crinalium sp.]|jgi:putative SOS response-associated peptidase YedK
MCGRFTLSQSGEAIATAFQLSSVPELVDRYNIAPTQPIPAILATADHPERQFKLLYWGLIPSWAKDPKMGARMINARTETVTEKPSFRTAFKRRRCLIVADGFYEWQRSESGKQPFYMQVGEHQPFAFAGLWEHWESAEGDRIDSGTILTTDANDLMQPIHDRMPVILHESDYDLWLDPTLQDTAKLQSLLRPYPSEEMVAYPVRTTVNSPKVDEPSLIQPLPQ